MSDVLYYPPGALMRLETYAYSTSRVGTIGVRLRSLADRSDPIARTTAGIAYDTTTSSHWIDTLTAPTTLGDYDAIFDIGETPPWPSQRVTVTYSAFVPGSPSGSDLTTLAQVKNWLGISDTTQDAQLQQLITAASKAVMEYAQREFAPISTSTTRSFALKRDGLVTFGKWDLQASTISSVQIDTETGGSPTTITQDQYQLRPVGATMARSLAFYTFAVGPVLRQYVGGLQRQVSVTGTWGFATIPADVEQATIITVAKWHKRDQTAWSNELPTPVPGDGLNLPYDARLLLQPHKRIV